ncbi:4-hydroxy-tetrahydrodipicolinate synthase [Actinomadura sp. WMMB 499]|nr:4-hydroxy-tetrahydrodipicolinate synthase [Actinomadura sp. WMMB 499]
MPPEALRGSYVPLVTPFRRGEVDFEAFAGLVDRQVEAGSAGIVVTGTSGEPSVLTIDERVRLYEVAVATAGDRLSVVAATGSQSHAETAVLTRRAQKAGATAVLVVTPYYIRPPQRGMVEYFVQIAGETTLPVLIYHIPGRSSVSLSVPSLAEAVRRAPNVVGVKHASTDLGWATDLLTELGPGFRLFCGLEELSFPMLALGAAGLMNAVGNLAPASISRLCRAVADGDLMEARRLHYELFPLNQAVFWDTNPIPIKYLMKVLGTLADNEHRLPMMPADPELGSRLDALVPRLRPLTRLPVRSPGKGERKNADERFA